jgi:hypothetical protein
MSYSHYERLSAVDDWDLVPDLHGLVEAVRAEFEALYRTVTAASAPVAAHRPVEAEARAMGAGAGR